MCYSPGYAVNFPFLALCVFDNDDGATEKRALILAANDRLKGMQNERVDRFIDSIGDARHFFSG